MQKQVTTRANALLSAREDKSSVSGCGNEDIDAVANVKQSVTEVMEPREAMAKQNSMDNK